MARDKKTCSQLEHELGNAKQEKLALQSMLRRASDEIEELVESNCEEPKKEQAIEAAKRFRRAASS